MAAKSLVLSVAILALMVATPTSQQRYHGPMLLSWRSAGYVPPRKPASYAGSYNLYLPKYAAAYENYYHSIVPRRRLSNPLPSSPSTADYFKGADYSDGFFAIDPSSVIRQNFKDQDNYWLHDADNGDSTSALNDPKQHKSSFYENTWFDENKLHSVSPVQEYNKEDHVNDNNNNLDDTLHEMEDDNPNHDIVHTPNGEIYIQRENQDQKSIIIQPRRRLPGIIRHTAAAASYEPAKNRFFFNQILLTTSSSFRFPFGKTSGVLITSTLNLTSVISCVASSEFVTANPTSCRRRRRGVERLLSYDDEENPSIQPSHIQKMESTAMINSAASLKAFEAKNARLHDFLESSKDDIIIDEDDAIDGGRNKRSFFFATTTTLTSFTFFTTTVTKTVQLLTAGTTSGLTCLPCSFTVCR